MRIQLPSVEYLSECFDCNPETGELVWKARPRSHFSSDDRHRAVNTRLAGKTVATWKDGYLVARVADKLLKAHRIVWKMTYGTEPYILDHINGVRSDNRIANLRACDATQNVWNAKISKNNTIGFKGVRKRTTRYEARLMLEGRYKSLGMFDTPQEAHAAYANAVKKHHGAFARTA